MFKKSFTTDFDETFETGPLTMSSEEFLKLYSIEIWGFPDISSHKRHQEFRRLQDKRKQTNARNTKKALFEGDFNQVKLYRI